MRVLFLFILLMMPFVSSSGFAESAHPHDAVHDQSSQATVASSPGQDDDALHEPHGQEAITAMSQTNAHMGPHFRWTTLRASNLADQEQAAQIVEKLREALAPYRDYRNAIKDGYEPFLPNVPQPHYHFTSKWRAIKSAFQFDPIRPTSLLYKKTADGEYELEGAMYTAPKRAKEKDLNTRIPLSVAQWHAHVNICLPPRRDTKTADWKKFGPQGSILTESECDVMNGRWVPQLFGWMIHVYPFRDSNQVWSH
jgi:hypothetical protein